MRYLPISLLALVPALGACQSISGLSDLSFSEVDEGGGSSGAGQAGQSTAGAAGTGGTAAQGGASGGSGAGAGGGAAGLGGAGQGGTGGKAGAGGNTAGTAGAAGLAGGGQGGLGGATSGAGGMAMCQPGNQPPVAEAPAVVNAIAGTEFRLDAAASSDPDGDPLIFLWEPLDGAPQPTSASESVGKAEVPECGDYSYRVTVTDPCGESSKAIVTVKAPVGGYVAQTKCSMSSACGGLTNPWCQVQQALTQTSGAVHLRVAVGAYDPVTLRDGVLVEGGYSSNFKARQSEPSPQGTVVVGEEFAVQGPTQGQSILDGLWLSPKPKQAQVEVVGVRLRAEGSLTIRNIHTEGGALPVKPQSAFGVRRGPDASGALVVEAGATLEAADATLLSAGVGVAGAGEVTLSEARVRGGAAEQSVGLDATHVGSLTVSGGEVTAGEGSQRAVGVRWVLPQPGAGAVGVLTGVKVRGGRGEQTRGVEAEFVSSLTLQNASIQGEEDDTGKPPPQRGVGVEARTVGDTSAAGLVLVGSSVVGATTAVERLGVVATSTGVQVEQGTIDGSASPGGRRAVGVRIDGSAIAAGAKLTGVVRVAGGAPTGQGQKYEAFGLELASASSVTVDGAQLVQGCLPSCQADVADAEAAAVQVTLGQHLLKNSTLLGGPQKGGAAAASARHAGVRLATGCTDLSCAVEATNNPQLAGNLASDELPGESRGVDNHGGRLKLLSNQRVVGGHALTLAVGVDTREGKDSTLSGNTVAGGAAKATYGLRTSGENKLLITANTVDACGLAVADVTPDPGCFKAEVTTGAESHDDTNSRYANNYVLGGFGSIATGCELGNSGQSGAVQFLYNLCLAQGRPKQAEPTNVSAGVRIVGLNAKAAAGMTVLNNLFVSANVATERYGGIEGAVSSLTMRNNDFFLLTSPSGLGPGLAYYKRGSVEIDDVGSLNQSSPQWTFVNNLILNPQFKTTPNATTLLTAAGLHLDASCALRDKGLVSSAEVKDFDGQPRGTGGASGSPEIGPDECPP